MNTPSKKRGRPRKSIETTSLSEKPIFNEYRLTLTLADQTYESSGTTPYDALRALPVPQKVTTKGVLTITHGDKSREMLLQIPRVKRLFYPLAQKFLSKTLSYGI